MFPQAVQQDFLFGGAGTSKVAGPSSCCSHGGGGITTTRLSLLQTRICVFGFFIKLVFVHRHVGVSAGAQGLEDLLVVGLKTTVQLFAHGGRVHFHKFLANHWLVLKCFRVWRLSLKQCDRVNNDCMDEGDSSGTN